MIPTPDERLREVLAALPPDFARDLWHELDRLRVCGGGEVAVTLRVLPDGGLRGGIMWWYERRGGAT